MEAMVTFVSDDGAQEDWTKLMPLFRQAGVPCVVAITSRQVGQAGYMGKEQIAYLQDELGWEVASHAREHVNLTELSEARMEEECSGSQEELRALGFGAQAIVYPYGRNNARVRSIASRYYDAGIEVGGGGNTGRADRYRLQRVALGSYFDSRLPLATNRIAYYKARVDEAVRAQAWLIFMLHPAERSHDGEQQRHLGETIRYVQAIGVPIVTVQEGLSRRTDLSMRARPRRLSGNGVLLKSIRRLVGLKFVWFYLMRSK
jgi:peptidoglycan/xylan/chitin deacetylase (PgdA/CDA1 family)